MQSRVDPWLIGVLLLPLAVMSVAILYLIPPDMDIFNHYHALACRYYPNAIYHAYREACNGIMDLHLFGVIPWPRSYNYVGAAYSILYYPFFLLWPDWHGVAVFDALLMVPGVIAASRLLRVRLPVATLALITPFPVLFYILRDYGQLTLQFSLLYVIPWVAMHAVQTPKRYRWLALNMAGGILLALGVESKPLFAYYVPSIAIVTMAACWSLREGPLALILLLLKRLWPGMLLCGMLLAILFTARDDAGRMYFSNLGSQVPSEMGFDVFSGHLAYILSNHWLNFPNASYIYYGLRDTFPDSGHTDWVGIVITLPFWLVFFGGALALSKKQTDEAEKYHDRIYVGLLLAAVAGVICVTADLHANNPHHILQPFYYLLGMLAIIFQQCMERRPRLFVLLGFIFVSAQIVCTGYAAARQPMVAHDWERLKVLDFIKEHNLAQNTIIDHLDWGLYYMSSLYGPREQLVTFDAPPEAMMELGEKLGRDVVFIKLVSPTSNERDAQLSALPGMRVVFKQQDFGGWEIWTNAAVTP